MVAQVKLKRHRIPIDIAALSADKRNTFYSLARELCLREMSPLRLYEPMPHQLAFHKSQAPERILWGSNRIGKTLALCMEIAWIVTGTHPYYDYPKRDGKIFLVGKDSKHLANTLWQYLAKRKPTFRMIRDLQTGKWRTWHKSNPDDLAREAESEPMLQLFDFRLIKDIAWEQKAAGIPQVVKFFNGWEIHFLSSLGSPPRGADVDVVIFDEEIINEEWYPEMSARLIDRNGRFIWGATPQSGTDSLYSLHQRALKEEGKERPLVEQFRGHQRDNVHLTERQKQDFLEKLKETPDALKVRWDGDFLVPSFRMYPNISEAVHSYKHFEIPNDWTRYLVIDPGNQVACGAFFAVPPPGTVIDGTDVSGCKFLYEEVYQRNTDIFQFAAAVKHRVDGFTFQAFLIDDHGSRKTETSGKTIYQQYADEFERLKIRSVSTGNAFRSMTVGNDQLEAGCEQVRAWLRVGPNGYPTLRMCKALAECIFEDMTRYHRKRDTHGNITDKPDSSKWSHGSDCVRYAAMHGLPYVKPSMVNRVKSWAQNYLASKRKEERDGQDNYIHCGSGV